MAGSTRRRWRRSRAATGCRWPRRGSSARPRRPPMRPRRSAAPSRSRRSPRAWCTRPTRGPCSPARAGGRPWPGRPARLAPPRPPPAGFLVQRMARPGVELLVGVTHDPLFGPVVACAAGGTAVELLADASVRLAPLTERDVHEMPRELATFPLLAGHRGAPVADVDALANDHPSIAELDCNPVIVTPAGATIVDMRTRVHPPAPRAPVGSLQGA